MKSPITSKFATIHSVVAATILALACGVSAGKAQASEPFQPLAVKVSYGDLNLDTESGAKVLYARLRYAANDVCSPYESQELPRQRVWKNCVNAALASAVVQINKPMVTAMHSPSVNRSSTG
jgi:UrcA family protein